MFTSLYALFGLSGLGGGGGGLGGCAISIRCLYSIESSHVTQDAVELSERPMLMKVLLTQHKSEQSYTIQNALTRKRSKFIPMTFRLLKLIR